MDITVKNVSLAGQTEAEVQALLAKAHSMFAGATVSFAAAEAKAVGFEQQLVTELHTALASIKKLLGLKPTVPAAAVVVAVQVAATPAAVVGGRRLARGGCGGSGASGEQRRLRW